MTVLITGASGYIGGRLISVLEKEGVQVRCLSRRPETLNSRVSKSVEVVEGDALDKESLVRAMSGVETAYYLVHSMGSSGNFVEEERRCAENFAEAASTAKVNRIIYLGGLGESSTGLSAHIHSRRQVGDILRTSSAQIIEFRASIVIGSGSISFEMVRALVERLPVMITPKWVATLAQPISITDVLTYLKLALCAPIETNKIIEIGGSDVVSYGELMKEYARQRGLRRFMIPVPFLTPRLSSLWLGLVTPVYARIGKKLVDSLRQASLVRDASASEHFQVQPMGISDAVAEAISNEDRGFAETRWCDAFSSAGKEKHWGGIRFGTRIIDSRNIRVDAPPPVVFSPIKKIGGQTGWYYGNSLWRLRGLLDLLVGGVGMRRGRRDPTNLAVGDTVDWWRVEKYEPDHYVRFYAEMKVPGRAWLEFEVKSDGDRSIVTQTVEFDPIGVPGLAYWYLLWPIHCLIFSRMLKGIVRTIEPRKTA